VAGKFCHKSSKTESFTKNLLQIQPSAIFIIAKFKQSLINDLYRSEFFRIINDYNDLKISERNLLMTGQDDPLKYPHKKMI
jgi:hypothetical protein